MRIYVNLFRNWAMFSVVVSVRNFKFLLCPGICCSAYLWVSLHSIPESLCLADIPAIIYCYYTGALLVCW